MPFEILLKEIISEAIVCHVVLSGELCQAECSKSTVRVKQAPCPLFPSCSGSFRSCPGSVTGHVTVCPLLCCSECRCIGTGLSWAVPAGLYSPDSQIMGL